MEYSYDGTKIDDILIYFTGEADTNSKADGMMSANSLLD
jgi:hypothetical protein